MVICPQRCADLHTAQLMPLPLTVSCSNKIQIGFTFLVLAHLGSPGQRAVKRVLSYFTNLYCTPVKINSGTTSGNPQGRWAHGHCLTSTAATELNNLTTTTSSHWCCPGASPGQNIWGGQTWRARSATL